MKHIVNQSTLPPTLQLAASLTGTSVPFGEQATRAATREDFLSLSQSLPNPDPVLRKLGQGIEVLRELLVDSHLSGAIASRKSGVMELEYSIGRGGDDSGEIRLIKSAFEGIDVQQLISDVLDAPLYGYQPIEIIWEKRADGHITPQRLEAKPQEWFDFDSRNRFRFRRDLDQPELLHPMKFLLPRYRATFRNPYGQALLSSCYWPVTIKRQAVKMFTVFVEKFGMPWPVAKYRPGMQIEEIQELVDMLDQLIQDGIIAIPTDGELAFLHGTANGGREVYKVLIELMNDEISKSILSHTGSIQSVGGKLGGEDLAADVRSSLIREGQRLVEETVNTLVRIIWLLNFTTSYPGKLFSLYDEEDVNQAQATRDWLLREMGVQFTKTYYQRRYGLDPEEFEISAAAQEIAPPEVRTGSPSKPDPKSLIRRAAQKASGDSLSADPRRSILQKIKGLRKAKE